MSLLFVLGVIAVAQVVFVILLALFVLVRRERLMRRTARLQRGRAQLNDPLVRWMAGTSSVVHLIDKLRALPNESALAFAAEIHDTRISPEQRGEFGDAIRGAPFIAWAIEGAPSWRWWRRLGAARALGMVGTSAHVQILRRLLDDKHPAVRLAATQALSTVADAGLIRTAVEHYASEAPAVRLYTTTTLRMVWQLAEGPVRECLTSTTASASQLAAWLHLAELLHLPGARPAVTALMAHPQPDVRASVARALRQYPHADSVKALTTMLDDAQDFVRASAAQALGALRASEALPQLERRLTDEAWWVRFRSATALALLGEPGRAALRRARTSADRYARDMATMTSGLAEGAVVELADT